MSPEQLTEILEIGMRAVSTCNNQPWRFRTRGEELDIFILRTKNFFLKLEGNTWIELGTLLENISAAAAVKGLKIEYTLFERCGLDAPAATVRFISGPTVPVDIDAIMRRATNRLPYSDQLLPEDVQEHILKACDDPNIDIQILSGTKKAACAGILANLEAVRLGNRLLVEEVLPYVRIDTKEIESCRDRLDIRAMGYDPFSLKVVQMAKKYPNLVYLAQQAFTKLGGQTRKFKRSLTQSGALIAFSLAARDQKSYVSLGRILQRTLNFLTEKNIQTYTIVSGLYLLDLLKENLEIYTEREQVLLLRHQYDLESFFNFPNRRVALFVKAGYADAPKYRSLRKQVQNVMIDEKGDPLSGK